MPYVVIIKRENEEEVRKMGPFSEHKAEKVERGANINLNHELFYTLIVPEDGE